MRHVWRKHPFALLSSILTPGVQVLLPLLVTWAAGRWFPIQFGIVDLTRVIEIVVALCGLWTIMHFLWRFRQAPQLAETPIGRRRALLHRVMRPLQTLIVVISVPLLTIMAVLLLSPFEVMRVPRAALIISYYIFLAFWLTLETIDWYNDQYILEEQRLIDSVRVPLMFRQQIVAPLEQVQDVRATTSFVGGIFNFGNVVVQTAGLTQPIVFESVSNPYAVQQIILQYMDDLAVRDRLRRQRETAEQIQTWIGGYHDLMTRIVVLNYTDTVPVGRPIRIVWRVMGLENVEYVTHVGWDMMSHANTNAYAHWTAEFRGHGSGIHRDIVVPAQAGRVFFKARVMFQNGVEMFSTPEQLAEVQP